MISMLILPLILPVAAGLTLWALPREDAALARRFTRAALALSSLCALIVALTGERSFTLWRLTDALSFELRTDALSRFYMILISVVWLLAGFYAGEYNAHDVHARRYDCFCLCTQGALMGLSMSANAVTFYMFYEMMTLLTVPLVMHNMDPDAVAAGIKYLIYSVFGASAALLGVFVLMHFAGTTRFVAGGILADVAGNEQLLRAIAFVMILGFGVKAGMFPLHAWLPTAHPVAPAPASAVLSGVITKAGVLGVIRTIFYLFGADFLRGSWVQWTLMTLALITVFMGSLLALREKLLKKRLAYSSVSQVSYVLFGISTLTPLGLVGALLHVCAHSLIKDTLFLSAGSMIHETGEVYADRLAGVGKRMPATLAAYTIASLGLIGIPPTSGFVSKWYLAQGGLSTGALGWIGPAVLLCSALMTAGYLLPLAIRAFFPGDAPLPKGQEASPQMWVPTLILAILSVLVGLFPNPLVGWFRGIAATLF